MALTPTNTQTLPWRDLAFLPLPQASQIAGVSTASLYKYEADGKLEFRRLAGRTLVTTSSLIRLIEGAEPWHPSDRGKEARSKRTERARATWSA